MSLSSAYPINVTVSGPNKLTDYTRESRNFLANNFNPERRLHNGRSTIISFLNTLPLTNHVTESFTLDIPFATANLMTFTVTGVFLERRTDHIKVYRHFNRVFVVVPRNSGFCIVNEMLSVTAATHKQVLAAKTGTSSFGGAAATPSTSAAAVITDMDKQQRIAQLSQETKMNANFSKMCLEQTNWNLQEALVSFQNARAEGKIPPEAFREQTVY